MSQASEIFTTHYQDYLDQIGNIPPDSVKEILGIETIADILCIPFLGTDFHVSGRGILDSRGERPGYVTCVILARYILNCPEQMHQDFQWVSFRDFRQTSHFTNVNYFTSDTEQKIANGFSGKLAALKSACEKACGTPEATDMPYDLAMSFCALPRISLLLLFNDRDEEFPAQCKVLFHRHSEFYLDPESLAMTGAVLAQTLCKTIPE